MNPLDGRYIHLQRALLGYQKTGIPLVEYDGTRLLPSCADDIGIYIIIPKIAHLLSLSIDQASKLFFYGTIFIAFLSGLIALSLLYPSWQSRFISLCGLLAASWCSFRVGHVYSIYASCTIALIPWCIYLLHKNHAKQPINYYIIAGFIIGLSHYIRAYASLPTAVFIIVATALQKQLMLNQKTLLLAWLLGSLAIPTIYFTTCYNQYLSFIHNETTLDSPVILKNHLFWHTIYCGFGFLKYMNNNAIEWADDSPPKKIPSCPPYATHAYENAVKKEVFKMLHEQTPFIVYTIFAKLGVLLLYFLLAANMGVVVALWYRKEWWLEAALWCSLISSAIFPLISLPIMIYSISFMTVGILYGIISINYAFHRSSDKKNEEKNVVITI